jgi:uncharacterized protein YfdQ (DUF2303 family)
MPIELSDYADGEGADLALVADLAARLEDAESEELGSGPGWAALRNGKVHNWQAYLTEPTRRSGTVTLADPVSFAAYVLRLRSPETAVYADKRGSSLTAVFNDHPESTEQATAGDEGAGFRDHRAVLALAPDTEWAEWSGANGRMFEQGAFGEFIDSMAHTIVEPDSATMLEVATSLTLKSKVDFSSRTRLDSGDLSFRFEQETEARAGKGAGTVEIPTSFVFEVSVWDGTPAVKFTARLRFKGDRDGVKMGFKMIRVAPTVDGAFRDLVDTVYGAMTGDGTYPVPVFYGSAGDSGRY